MLSVNVKSPSLNFFYLKVTSHQGPDDLQAALEGCAAVVIPAGVPRKPGKEFQSNLCLFYLCLMCY